MDCEGQSGGLAMLWKQDVEFTVLQYSKSHIHGEMELGSSG